VMMLSQCHTLHSGRLSVERHGGLGARSGLSSLKAERARPGAGRTRSSERNVQSKLGRPPRRVDRWCNCPIWKAEDEDYPSHPSASLHGARELFVQIRFRAAPGPSGSVKLGQE